MVMGLLLHKWCGQLAFLAPYLIFTILLLNFVAVDLRKLHLTKMNVWIMVYQTLASVGSYFLVRAIFHNELLAQGVFIGILCPVAASVVVVSCMLGANRETITEYTVFGNLLIVVIGFAAEVLSSFVTEVIMGVMFALRARPTLAFRFESVPPPLSMES